MSDDRRRPPADPKNPDPKDDRWLKGQAKDPRHGKDPNTDGKK